MSDTKNKKPATLDDVKSSVESNHKTTRILIFIFAFIIMVVIIALGLYLRYKVISLMVKHEMEQRSARQGQMLPAETAAI